MKIHAPYNFVPLSAWVFQPDWADKVTAEVPFEDGYSGVLDLEIKAHTPILVGGEQEPGSEEAPGKVRFFRMPDGTPAIPGSSLKGMIRNVMEIAAFGKMSAVDDRWLSIRDLTPGAKEIYRSKFTDKNLNPLVRAGFLKPVSVKDTESGEEFCWELVPCSFCRVDHEDIIDWGKEMGIGNGAKIRKRQIAVEKYKIWREKLDVTFDLPEPRKARNRKGEVTPEHMKARNLGGGSRSGRLVFTGQPQANTGRKRQKHLEFIFYDPKPVIRVEEEVARSFLHIHEDSPEWKFWRERFGIHLGVPVFYLERAGYPTAMGLAMMFRLAYDHSIGDTIEHTSFLHRSDEKDLPELMFGSINEEKGGLRGRVSFGMAALQGSAHEEAMPTTILNGPKPGYYPGYIVQKHDSDGRLIGGYSTYMSGNAEIRGWKRYPARPDVGGFQVEHGLAKDKEISNKVKVDLFPLAAGSVFRGRLRVHNMRYFELGALVWALTWGDNPALRHGLGMGKPFGMGQISIRVSGWSGLRSNKPGGSVPDMNELVSEFESRMDACFREAAKMDVGWLQSEQMVQLRAMADPESALGLPGSNHYMPLEAFRNVKGRKMEEPSYALLPYAKYDGPRDHELFSGVSRLQWEELKKEKEAQAAEAARMATMTPLQQELDRMKRATNVEEQAARWLARLDDYQGEDQQEVARALRDVYEMKGKWSGKLAPKQKIKVARIRAILEQGGEA